jgi:hypothetical protein
MVAAATVLAACGPSEPPPFFKALSRSGPESIFEPKGPLFADPPGTLKEMKRLGIDRVKVYVGWNAIAPDPLSRTRPRFDATNPSAYPASGWTTYDQIVRAAKARGIALYFAVGGPAPLWAAGPRAPRGAPYGGAAWKPSASQFGLFVRAVATRYGGHYVPSGASSPLPRITFWSIWNEPNLGSAELAPQAIDHSTVETSPAMYRRIVDAAWSALQSAGHGRDSILIGEIAPYGQTLGNSPGNFGEMVPMRFVRALYCVDQSLHPLRGSAARVRACPETSAGSNRFAASHPGLFRATGFAVHPYPSGSVAPDRILPDPDFVNLATLGRLQRFLDSVTTTYGAARQYPLYITEYGYFTNPPYQLGAPLATAAADLNWAEYIAWEDLRVRSVDQYLLVDPATGGPSNFDTGLDFFGGHRKPTYAAYRMPIFLPATSARKRQSLEVWGCVRPAHYVQIDTGALQRVKIELAPPSGGPFKSLGEVTITNPHGYFDTRVRFPSSGTVRLAWSYPHGPTVYSRTVAITVG